MATIEDGWLPLDDLKPHPLNYNRHDKPGAIEKMAARVRCNAFTAPPIVTPDGLVLGGHLRRLGLLKLRADNYPEPEGVKPGWLVPVRIFTGNEVQERAILVGDNPNPADIDFDNEALAALLADLQREGALEGAGYSDEALDALIGELAGEAGNPGGGVDPNVEWEGMPEFEQPDSMPFRTLNVHFADEEAAQEFAAIIGQKLTEHTKYVWHPEQKPQNRLGMQYVADEP